MLALASGCDPQNGPDHAAKSDYGHVAIQTSYSVRAGDVYRCNDASLTPSADHKLDAVVREPVGTATIYLQRPNLPPYRLCTALVKKDRVVSVSLEGDLNGNIICKVSP